MLQLERTDIDGKIDSKILVQLTNDDPNSSIADELRISKVIDLTNSLIEDALRGQYPLPLKSKHAVLTGIGIEICIYNFYLIRTRTNVPESVKVSYQSSLNLLSDYSKGFKKLDEDTGVYTPVSVVKVGKPQVFTTDLLSRF